MDGALVVGPSDLNQNTAFVWKTVSLQRPQSALKVKLASAPGSYLSIEICGATGGNDVTPPWISVAAPAPGTFVASATPTVRVSYGDDVALDLASLRILVAGVDRTSLFSVGASEAVATLPASAALAEGPASISASIRDTAGNPGAAQSDFTVDSQPPQVVIVSPGHDEYVSETQLDVSGQASDASLVGVTVAGLPAVVEYGSFTARSVPIGAGPDVVLEAVATDAAGNVGRASVTLHVDRTAPTLTISSPAAGALVRGPQVRVQGQSADATPVTVTIDGQPAVMTGNVFEGAVLAADGPLQLEVVATDAAGNQATASVAVTVDGQAPAVALTSPAPGTVTNATEVTLAGSVTDGSDVTLRVDGTVVPVSGGQFSTSLALPSEGSRHFAVTAEDAAGNVTQTGVDIVVDRTPPALAVAQPPEGALLGAQPVLVAGTAQDTTAVTVTVDTVEAPLTGTAWSLPRSGLVEGENVIVVVARDAAGNESRVERRLDFDGAAPVVTIAEPADGALTREAQATVRGTADDARLASVAVNGVAATLGAGGSGPRQWLAAGIALNEGDNTLTAVARDSLGREGRAQVQVTRDSTPPQLTLQAPERIVAGQTATAQATASDERGLARVVFSLQGAPVATSTAPPFELSISVPAGTLAGQSLVVEAEAFDQAGNSTRASRGLRVVADGVVAGLVLSDRTGLPLPGASVRLLGSPAAPQLTNEEGGYSFQAVDATATLQAEMAGMTRVERSVRLESGSGVVPIDARLTPLADPVAVGPAGGLLAVEIARPLSAPADAPPARVEVELPAGALAAQTDVRLTVLTGQGLPALLPLGFSPIVAFQLDPEDLDLALPLALRVGGLPAGSLLLVEFRPALHAWVLREAGLVATDGALAVGLSGPGSFALVAADQEPQAPVLPAPGEPLVGIAPREIPAEATSAGTVVPATLPPSGGTARGRTVVTTPAPLPSGTVVQTEAQETYELADGTQASTEKRRQDLLLYRGTLQALETQTTGAPTLEGELPLTPSRTYATSELTSGKLHLDVLAGREDVRGTAGGNQAVIVTSGPARLSIPAGALAENTAVTIESVALSTYLPSGPDFLPFGEVVVDFAGRTLALPAELEHEAGAVATGGTYVLARVERVGGVPHVGAVAWAARSGDRVTTVVVGDLPGLRSGGRYVFYRLAGEAGLVAGFARAAGAPVAAIVTSDRLPFVALAGADGAYALLAAVGESTVTGRVPGTPLLRSVTVQVSAAQTTLQDLELLPTATTVTVTPPDGATGVATNAQVQLQASAPLDPVALATATTRLGQVGTSETVGLRSVLSASGRTLALIPLAGLANETTYELQVIGLRDLTGEPVAVPAARFTTRAFTPPTYDFSRMTFSYPEDGFVTVQAPAGTFAPLSQIYIANANLGDQHFFQAGNAGELQAELIRASISDRLLITVTDPDGNVFSFERSEFVAPDGTTGIGPAGGTVRGPDGLEMRVPDGALTQGVTLKLESFGPDGFPESEWPDLGTDDQGQPLAHFGAGMKITTADQRVFAKEAALAFPKPADAPDGAFYFVLQKIQRSDGTEAYLTVDQATLQGDKVVTASPPFEGYVSHTVGLGLGGTALLYPATQAISILMWTYDQLMPGRARMGVVTGRVYKTVWDPAPATQPRYVPVPGLLVSRADGQGVPEVTQAGLRGIHFAFTSSDGTFTFWDPQYIGGHQTVAALDPNTGERQSAVVYEVVNASDMPPLLRFYRNVAQGNITFPASQAPPPPTGFLLKVFRVVEEANPDPTGAPLRKRYDAQGSLEIGKPYVVGVKLLTPPLSNALPTVTIGSTPATVSADQRLQPPPDQNTVDYVTAEQIPTEVGPVTIEATLLPAFGQPVRRDLTVLVLGSGGSTVPLDGAPKVVSARTVPPNETGEVSVDITPQIVFSEPVTKVRSAPGSPAGVRLLQMGTDGQEHEVPIDLFGIGADGQPKTDAQITPDTVVTALTLRPRTPLLFGQMARIIVSAPVEDRDLDAQGQPAPKQVVPYSSSFTTVAPLTTPPPETPQINSPGLAVIGNRAYLATSQSMRNTVVHVFDVTDPQLPEPLPSKPVFAPRPVGLLGFSRQAPFPEDERILVVATGPTNKSKPSSLVVLKADDDFAGVAANEPLPLKAAVSLASSALEGYITRLAFFDGRIYSATARRGLQVVDLAMAAEQTEAHLSRLGQMNGTNDILRLVNTDGAGFGAQAVVNTIPLTTTYGPDPQAPPRAAWLADLDVDAFEAGGDLAGRGGADGGQGALAGRCPGQRPAGAARDASDAEGPERAREGAVAGRGRGVRPDRTAPSGAGGGCGHCRHGRGARLPGGARDRRQRPGSAAGAAGVRPGPGGRARRPGSARQSGDRGAAGAGSGVRVDRGPVPAAVVGHRGGHRQPPGVGRGGRAVLDPVRLLRGRLHAGRAAHDADRRQRAASGPEDQAHRAGAGAGRERAGAVAQGRAHRVHGGASCQGHAARGWAADRRAPEHGPAAGRSRTASCRGASMWPASRARRWARSGSTGRSRCRPRRSTRGRRRSRRRDAS